MYVCAIFVATDYAFLLTLNKFVFVNQSTLVNDDVRYIKVKAMNRCHLKTNINKNKQNLLWCFRTLFVKHLYLTLYTIYSSCLGLSDDELRFCKVLFHNIKCHQTAFHSHLNFRFLCQMFLALTYFYNLKRTLRLSIDRAHDT